MNNETVFGMMETRPRPRFANFSPEKTAHVVVDLQNGFLEPGGRFEVPTGRATVPRVNQICAAVRRAGGLNVFLRYTVDPGEARPWTSYRELMPEQQRRISAEMFRRGTGSHDLWPGLDLTEQDVVLDKTRPSAMIAGTCDLDDLLRARGFDSMIITGVVTNGCCESTARDAAQLGYRVFFIEDATAAWCEEDHATTLRNLTRMAFADVRSTDEMLAAFAA